MRVEGRAPPTDPRPPTALARTFSLGFGVQGSGFRVQGSGFRVQGSGSRVQGAGFRVQGSGFRVQGAGFRVQEFFFFSSLLISSLELSDTKVYAP